jgi:hypothetical protein
VPRSAAFWPRDESVDTEITRGIRLADAPDFVSALDVCVRQTILR